MLDASNNPEEYHVAAILFAKLSKMISCGYGDLYFYDMKMQDGDIIVSLMRNGDIDSNIPNDTIFDIVEDVVISSVVLMTMNDHELREYFRSVLAKTSFARYKGA